MGGLGRRNRVRASSPSTGESIQLAHSVLAHWSIQREQKVGTYQSDGITVAFSILYLVFYLSCLLSFTSRSLTLYLLSLPSPWPRKGREINTQMIIMNPLRKKKEKIKNKRAIQQECRWFLSQASTAQRQSQIPLLVSGPAESEGHPPV